MKSTIYTALLFGAGILLGMGLQDYSVRAAGKPVELENLLRQDLQVADGIEIIVSRVRIAPGQALPKHYHPGEEYVYVLDGEATLWQSGKPDLVMRQGDVYGIPLEQVHTASTGAEGATALVFRVHRKGQPERIPAND